MKSIYEVDFHNISELQRFIHAWANRAFPGRNPDASLFKLVMEEVPELLYHKKLFGKTKIGYELADCFILLLDLAEIWKVDLSEAIQQKMEINMKRNWELDPATGFYNHKTPDILDQVETAEFDSEGGTHD